MRATDLVDLLDNRPFQPFDIHVEGKTVKVSHPEQVILNKSKTLAVVVPDDHIHVVDIEHIGSLTLQRRQRTRARRN